EDRLPLVDRRRDEPRHQGRIGERIEMNVADMKEHALAGTGREGEGGRTRRRRADVADECNQRGGDDADDGLAHARPPRGTSDFILWESRTAWEDRAQIDDTHPCSVSRRPLNAAPASTVSKHA